jgi:lysophospholipase
MAHSMGGGIGVLYLDEHPDTFAAAALSSPMIEINAGAFPESLAQTIADGDCSRSSGKSYAPGQGPFNPNLRFTDADNDVTRSQPRFESKMEMFRSHPELQPGGASYRWICEAFAATSYMQTLGKYSRVPTLVFQAGNEKVVGNDGEDRYCDEASRCQKVVYPDGYHENFNERDAIRNDALTKAMRFFRHFGT